MTRFHSKGQYLVTLGSGFLFFVKKEQAYRQRQEQGSGRPRGGAVPIGGRRWGEAPSVPRRWVSGPRGCTAEAPGSVRTRREAALLQRPHLGGPRERAEGPQRGAPRAGAAPRGTGRRCSAAALGDPRAGSSGPVGAAGAGESPAE